jgi:hypothetical protein
VIKAIDTEYKGYKFRSRLEARFAVYLDALNASWEYEKEGYSLPVNGNYLPDFLISSFPKCSKQFWLEVKATKPTQTEIHKLRELCVLTQTPGAFFVGSTKHEGQQISTFSAIAQHDPEYYGWHVPDAFSYSQAPLDTYIEDNSVPTNFWAKYSQDLINNYDIFLRCADCNYLKPAAKAALSARFEFGESG